MNVKIKLNKLVPVLLAVIALSFSSCLKENEDTFTDFTKVESAVELPLAALNTETKVTVVPQPAYTASAAGSDLEVFVNVAGPKAPTSAVTVTLGINANNALANLNTSTGKTYIMLPAAGFTPSGLSVTIPAGQRMGSIKIKINTSVLSKTEANYVLPVSITDGGGQKISLYSTVFYNIKVK